jgi:peptidoglycan/LPS O-acetylase OafA/YrhL
MRIEQLTFTRFVAAIAIVFFHVGKTTAPFNHDSISFLFKQANIGVSYFFILSGFVMIVAYKDYDKISFLDYIKKRFARIYPVYILAIILLFSYFLIANKTIYLKSLVLNITMLQAWIPGEALSFNSPGWSISVELLFYALFPFIFNTFYRPKSFKINAIIIVSVFIISQIIFHYLLYSSFYTKQPSKPHDFVYYFPLMHLNEFLLGNLAGLYFIKYLKPKNYDWSIILLLFILIISLKLESRISYHNGALAIVFIPLILLIACNTGRITKLLKQKQLVFLGKISFGIYILQMPIIKYTNGALKTFGIQSTTVIVYSTLIILILVAAIIYKYLENPLRHRIRKMTLNN